MAINPPNTPANPSNVYWPYTEAVHAALAISRTNPSITYYLAEFDNGEDDEIGYRITTSPDETSAHAFVAGQIIPL